MRIVQAAIGVAAVLTLAGAARAEGLAVKTGLWEVSSSGGPGGGPARPMPQLPPDALAKLTPAQQAMVQAQMAAGAGGGAAKPIVRKMCVTQAMLQKGFGGQDGKNCTRTVVSVSAAALQMNLSCTGDHPATGTFTLQAVDAQTVNGTMDMTITDKSGQTFPMHRTTQGKWLGADCGSVKPIQ